jgi:hypothetical protein
MALDVYSTLACSDELERVFGYGSALLASPRRQLAGDHVHEILCLRSWQYSGTMTLDRASFGQAIRQADGPPISDQLPAVNSTHERDDEVLYHEH